MLLWSFLISVFYFYFQILHAYPQYRARNKKKNTGTKMQEISISRKEIRKEVGKISFNSNLMTSLTTSLDKHYSPSLPFSFLPLFFLPSLLLSFPLPSLPHFLVSYITILQPFIHLKYLHTALIVSPIHIQLHIILQE